MEEKLILSRLNKDLIYSVLQFLISICSIVIEIL